MSSDNVRLGVSLNGYGPRMEVLAWDDMVELVSTSEETGYERVFTPETGAREAFSMLAGFAVRTTRIGLASGVVPTWARHPRAVAMGAATLDDVSGGRFTLGLGSLDTIERTRWYVSAVRDLLEHGEPTLETANETFAIGGIDLVPERPVPLYLAALGPRMTELAGEVADGVILTWCTPERVALARDEIARGAARSGRDPASVTISVFVRACLGHDDEHAADALGTAAGRYAAMPKYLKQFEAMGLGEAARAAAATGGTSGAKVPSELIAAVCVWGERDDALERLGEYRDAGADLVVVYPVPAGDATSSLMGTILACAPDPALAG